jgi:hypothetical protein
MGKGNTSHQFPNSLTVPIIAYCNDIALVRRKPEDLEEAMGKLVQFGSWAGLDVNTSKSTYTDTRASRHAVL